MGYTTTFKGTLRFATEPTAPQLAFINAICGEDCRAHPEWDAGGLTYMDLAITKDFGGLAWDGSEKTYDLTEKVNLLTRLVRAEWPDFALRGELEAQGEDATDAWVLRVDEDGIAHKMVTPLPADLVQCPECGHGFRTGQSARSAPK